MSSPPWVLSGPSGSHLSKCCLLYLCYVLPIGFLYVTGFYYTYTGSLPSAGVSSPEQSTMIFYVPLPLGPVDKVFFPLSPTSALNPPKGINKVHLLFILFILYNPDIDWRPSRLLVSSYPIPFCNCCL